MNKWSVVAAWSFVTAVSSPAWTQSVVFDDVKARFSKDAADRRLVDKDAVLVMDDNARRLIVKNHERPLDVAYDDVQTIVLDVSTHMRGGVLGALIGGVAGIAIQAKHVNDYWCYLEYSGPDGARRQYMVEVAKESSAQLIAKMQSVFPDKVKVAEFAEREEALKKETLKELQSKHDVNVDKKNHPVPEVKADKALVVVVCPSLAARFQGKGIQVKLHANDRVVAVNKMGTYSFAYLDPGDYLLVSQSENASGLRMKLEAGAEYYFLQDTFTGAWKNRTALSRHTRELVLYELSGAYYSNWRSKDGSALAHR